MPKALSATVQQQCSYQIDQASSSSSKSVIGEEMVIRQSRHVAMALPTSPESISPSSLFDYDNEDEEEEGQDTYNDHVRGWISQTSKHLQSSEMPSSRSPKKVISPWNAQFNDLRSEGDLEEDEVPNSPTLQIGSRKNDIRRVKSLPNWQSRGSNNFGTRQLSRASTSKEALITKTTPVQKDHKCSRPATPSSSVRRREALGLLDRPQSAMKHKSANEYSSGKNVPTITISSGSLPQSQDDEEEEPIFKSAKVTTNNNNSFSNRIRGVTSMRKEQLRKEAGTVQNSSPIRSDSDGFSPSPIKKSTSFSAITTLKRKPYVLHSRQSLPNNDFYQRTKQEEGSPTPAKRIKSFAQFE